MDWLLTEKERNAARFQASCSKGYLPLSGYGLELLIEEIAKAQAKKIVDIFIEGNYPYHHEDKTVHVPYSVIRTLLKEVEG